jgi:preprotein translocase subunit SecA
MIERLFTLLAPVARGRLSDDRLIPLVRDEARLLLHSTDAELKTTADRLRELKNQPGTTPATVLVSAFAAVVESVHRAYGKELYDVQLSAGLAIARGEIAEMQTGEGKTLAAALPAFFRAIGGDGVHVVTPNAYLAGRDFELLATVYQSLGMSVGLLPEGAAMAEKRAAYDCDITYGTGYEFGFDYLREQLQLLARRRAGLGARYQGILRDEEDSKLLGARRGFAIIDEIDSVLIDEACTPLILANGIADEAVAAATYEQALRAAATLTADVDYVAKGEGFSGIALTAAGRRRCYEAICSEATPTVAGPWADSIQQALVALFGLSRDVDYVVSNGRIVLVDATTGRLCPDRKWHSGLQQFLEVKEGLRLTPIQPNAARITRQRFFGRYAQLAGMTGTAAESARELRGTYGLRTCTISPRLPSRRTMLPDRVFIDDQSRWRAVENEIARLHAAGRPVLVGCRTIERSQQLAARLDRCQIRYQLLNGKQTAAEAEVIARAGRQGAVTIATNMAGRGTDIQLAPGVAELGGLHLIGIERNDSRRIDRQLTGRVARQGDPGSYQFFVSADDALVQVHGPTIGQRIKSIPNEAGEVPADLSGEICAMQGLAESAAFRLRQELAAADTWLCDELGELLQ